MKIIIVFPNHVLLENVHWPKTTVSTQENPFAISSWRILKNSFPLYGKVASTLKNILKNWKNWCPPNFHLQKRIRNKAIDKEQIKTSFPRFQYVLVKLKNASTVCNWLLSKKMKKISFHYPKNQFSLVKMWSFIKN